MRSFQRDIYVIRDFQCEEHKLAIINICQDNESEHYLKLLCKKCLEDYGIEKYQIDTIQGLFIRMYEQFDKDKPRIIKSDILTYQEKKSSLGTLATYYKQLSQQLNSVYENISKKIRELLAIQKPLYQSYEGFFSEIFNYEKTKDFQYGLYKFKKNIMIDKNQQTIQFNFQHFSEKLIQQYHENMNVLYDSMKKLVNLAIFDSQKTPQEEVVEEVKKNKDSNQNQQDGQQDQVLLLDRNLNKEKGKSFRATMFKWSCRQTLDPNQKYWLFWKFWQEQYVFQQQQWSFEKCGGNIENESHGRIICHKCYSTMLPFVQSYSKGIDALL